MSQRDSLNLYIRQIQQRLRLAATLRGAATLALAALATTLLLAAILNHYAFPEHALTPARLTLLAALLLTLTLAAIPLLRLTLPRTVTRAEAHFPAFEQRLTTFAERQTQQDPFLDLLAADTLTVAAEVPPARLVPATTLALFLAATVFATGLLTWLVKARPGALGYGASLLWTGPHHEIPPLYDIRVAPGDIAVRRNTDQIVTAQITGLDPAKVTLLARFASATAWQRVPMQPQPDTPGFQFLFAGLPEDVEYYVEAGPAASAHFHIRTVDLPAVKQIQVTYRYPKWTGMQTVSEDQAGDLRALEGTEADLTVTMSAPLKEGILALDGAQPIKLTGGEGNKYHAIIHMAKDGAYHVAATDQGQQVRLSEDYFLSTSKANPPTIAIDRPTADYRASPIEEVRIGLKAAADFPLHHVTLHYSVNGAPEQTVNILKSPGAKNTDGATTLALEDFHLLPGDVVSLYATAADAHAEARTEISFVQIEPFEREFSQSQSGGGAGGGGGGGAQPNSQTDIARREKELIEATWKQRNDKAATPQQAAATAKLLAEAQSKLRDQALALTARMESRDLSQANEEFNSFGKDMQTAAAAMVPSADKLAHQQWQDAMPIEQKALQALLRAEATFRKIEVAFGQKGGGGGGGGGSAGRDLASLFDLEMDTEKNQYETAQTGSAAEQQAKKVDDALAKLDALARRQEELAQQQQTAQQTFQQRWQQEMLRREAEQLQREMEQMQAQQKGQQGQQGQSGQQGQQGQQSGQQSASNQAGQSGQFGQPGQSGSSQGGQSQSGSQSGKQSASSRANSPQADPLQRTVQQSLDRLRAANEEMRRAGGAQGGQQQSAAEAHRAAEQLREATNLLGGAQKQQATGKLDSLANEAARLAQQEAAQADRIRSLSSQSNGQGNGMEPQTAQNYQERAQQRAALAGDRQRLSDDLSHLQRNLRDTARQLAPNQPAASNSLRDALSAMDQEDLTNLTQRTADWLRRGINPNSNGTETQIAGGLKKLDDQIRQAQQASGSGQRAGKSQDPGTQTAALDHVGRLRSQLQALSAQGTQDLQGQQPGQSGQPGNQQGSPGQNGRQGQSGPQPGQGNQAGQRGQSGQGSRGIQQASGNQLAQGSQPGQQGQGSQPGQGGQRGGSRQAQPGQPGGGQQSGQQTGQIRQGGGGTAPNWNVNTGNNTYANGGPAAPSNTPNPADTERTIRQGINELNQLRALARNDPAAQKEIDALAREMQRLDPSRFPGNPAMVEQLHTQVLAGVDKLELQLRHDAAPDATQVRATAPPIVPPGYQDAVADYFRRLGQTR